MLGSSGRRVGKCASAQPTVPYRTLPMTSGLRDAAHRLPTLRKKAP